MATDIALTQAAVVVYDTATGNDTTLDYVAARRGGRPLIVVFDRPDDRDQDLLVPPGTTSSALLEAQLRGTDAPPDGPTAMSTGERMARLRPDSAS